MIQEQATSTGRASATPQSATPESATPDSAAPKPVSSTTARRRTEPARVPGLAHLSLAELRAYREELNTEETRVSYWRRILQARHDLIVDNRDPSTRGRLREVLADHEQKSRRLAVQTMHDPSAVPPPLPELAELWDTHSANLASGLGADPELVARLAAAERKLSAYRRSLHERLDEVTGDLVARYRENPELALVALKLGPAANRGAA